MIEPTKCYLMKADQLLNMAEEITPEDGKSFKLPELYRMLDCSMIEVLRLEFPARWLIFDEEGNLMQKPVNIAATVLSRLFPHNVIVGHAIICPHSFLD